MKVGPLVRAFRGHPEVELSLVHTGQHYDERMSEVFFRDLGLPEPDINLGVGAGTPSLQTARILEAFEPVLAVGQPHLVIVVGDVTSTLACALGAAQRGVPVAHVEAGLRSFDADMPEERNRILTDHLSQLLFTTEESGNRNLEREGVPAERVRFVGNVMIDSLMSVRDRADAQQPWARWGLQAGHYVLATLHRPSNVDDDERLRSLVEELGRTTSRMPVLFPVHPRTAGRIATAVDATPPDLQLVDPIGYVDFVGLMSGAALVVTDSGGVQEETTVLGVPCLTVRPNTERPSTIELGTNRLITPDQDLGRAIEDALSGDRTEPGSQPPLWDGHAAERIVAEVLAFLRASG